MALLEMGRMRNRYRLTRGRLDARPRLDRISRSLLDGVLEQALHTSRLTVAGEVCIRSLDVPVRVRLSAGDAEIAAVWSRAIAASIGAALESGDPGVVTYASRRHALLDMAASVARGEAARAWAWAQLGLWRAPAGASDAGALEEVVRSLAAAGEEVVAVCAGLARLGLLPRLVARLEARQVRRLALAAAMAAGLELSDVVASTGDTRLVAEGDDAGGALRDGERSERLAARLAAQSAIFTALAGDGSPLEDVDRGYWMAVLIALEADPGTVARSGHQAAALVGGIAYRLARPGVGSGSTATPELGGDELGDGLFTAPTESGPGAAEAPAAGRSPEATPAAMPELPPDAGRPDPDAGADRTAEPGAAPPPPDPRRRAFTDAGGLLFLVHLVARLQLPARLGAAPELQGRSLRWALHRLAMILAGLAEDDPAALAFCGLGADARPPALDGGPPSEPELALLEAAAAELAQSLADALERRLEPPALVLAEVCARRAEIVAELGWIDVLLDADAVSIDVRRAGLDLDPGWVPWLGVVLRFLYE